MARTGRPSEATLRSLPAKPGVYLFRLTPGGFDTRALRNAVYDLIVTVADIRGNQTTSLLRFTVANAR